MSDTTAAGSPAPMSTGSKEPDWADQVTDLIVDVVNRVHDRTTGRAVMAARWAVYGLVIGAVAALLGVLFVVLAGRALELIPGEVWIPYLAAGAVLVVAGMAVWSTRPRTDA